MEQFREGRDQWWGERFSRSSDFELESVGQRAIKWNASSFSDRQSLHLMSLAE